MLRDDKTFISGDGVALNPFTNRLSRGTTLNSDGDEHDQRRKLVAHRMLPRALRTISDDVDQQAAAVVDRRPRDGVRWTASTIWRPRCRMRWCPISSAGRAISATTCCAGAAATSTSSAR